MRQKNRFWIFWIIMLLAIMQVSATVDLVNPIDQSILNYQNITFDYYPDLANGLDECSLIMNSNVLITDSNVQNSAPNSFSVANIPEDNYAWEVLCDGPGGSENSAQYDLILDVTAPVVTLISPIDTFDSGSDVSFTFKVTDNYADQLNCNLTLDGLPLQSVTANNNTQTNIDITGLNPGNHEWGITCSDEANNKDTKTRTIIVSNDIVFSINLDKNTFSLGEEGILTILAPNSTNLTLEICPDGQGFVECFAAITLEEPTYPRQETLPYTNVTGNYIIDAYFSYQDIREARRLTYTVNNNMAVTINGKTTIKDGEYLQLSGSASGGSGALSYEWTLHNGTTQSGSDISILLPNSGLFDYTLTATDEVGNFVSKDTTINVIPSHQITVSVKDESGTNLEGVAIDLDGDKETTEPDGVASFLARANELDLVAFLTGYETHRETITADSDKTISITLIKQTSGLEIVLDSPEDESSLLPGETTFGFFLKKGESAVCKLYTDKSGSDFFEEIGSLDVTSESKYEFEIGLEKGDYEWFVECIQNSETVRSSERSLTIENTEEELEETTEETTTASEINTDGMLDELGLILESYDELGSKEKTLLEDLGHYKHAKNMIKKVQRATRDIHDLRFRTSLTDEQKEEERQNIVNSIHLGFDQTVKDIRIKDTKIFVKYPEKEELEPLSKIYGEHERFEGSPDNLAEAIYDLQDEVVISTKVHIVTIETLDGSSETITVLTKEIKTELDKGQYKIVDYIPKDLAQSVDDLTFITGHKVIQEDPVVEFNVEDKIIYYFNDELDISSLNTVISAIVKDGMTNNLKAITGSATLFVPEINFNSKTFLIIVAILLIIFYFIGESSFVDTLKEKLSGKKKDKEIHYIRILVNDALDNLEADQYDKASLIYREIKLTYDNMMQGAKEEVFSEIMILVNKLDISYSRDLSAKIEEALTENDYDTAQDLYRKLQATYRKLDEDYKKEIYSKITSITGKLKQ